MTIEIHQPRLEALIQERMASGHFQSVEDLLLQTLETEKKPDGFVFPEGTRKTMEEALTLSRGLLTDKEVDGLFKRDSSVGRPIDLS